MSATETYNIAFKGLKNGTHQFKYHLDKTFFESIESSLIEDGDLQADVEMIKSEQMLRFHFCINGTIKATCDVCLGQFDYPIENCEGDMVVKFGLTTQEIDDELFMLAEEEDEISIAQWMYEIIGVSLPIRFEHPTDAEGNSTCDPDMLAKLNEYLVTEKTDTDEALGEKSNSSRTDPRWDALKGLLDKQ